MGELPSFITGVPVDSISKQQISSGLIRKQTRIIGNVGAADTFENIFTVPKGEIFELLFIHSSIINTSTGFSNRFTLQTQRPPAPVQILLRTTLPFATPDVNMLSFGKEILIFDSGTKFSMDTNSDVEGTNWDLVLVGNLIDRAEFVRKTNIVP